MLKTLKWVYDLGVKQERVRIARELEAEVGRRNVEGVALYNMYHDKSDDTPKKRKERLMFRSAVTDEVKLIVEQILKPQYEPSATASVMFPEEPEKK